MEIDYQAKCRNLKRKLKILLYEQESFLSELEKAQRKLLKVSRDKSFLLDRLLLYEQVTDDSSEDSDATLSSDCEVEVSNQKKRNVAAVPKTEPNVMIKSEFPLLTETQQSVTEVSLSSAISDTAVPFEPIFKSEFSQTTESANNEADQGASDTSLNISDVERQLSSSLVANANSSISPLDPFPTTDLPQDVFE